MNPLVPQFDGEMRFDHLPDDFVARLRRRIESGLLPGSRGRSNYRVRSEDSDGIRFGAEGWATEYAIGLNEVAVTRVGADVLRYEGSYWRWTRYAVLHGATLGAMFLIAYAVWPQLRADVSKYHALGGVTFFGMVGFFGFVWPWLLAMLHRRAAESVLRNLLVETMR